MKKRPMCDRIGCEKEAVVKGFVLVRNGGVKGEDVPVDVCACAKHRKSPGFFETAEVNA